METIRETLRQERVLPEQEGLSTGIREAHSEIDFLRRRLNRLVKLQSVLKERYRRRLSSLNAELSDIDIQLRELTSLARQLRRNKESQATIKEQIVSLERRRKTLREVVRQVAEYRRSSHAQVELIEEEQEILLQRICDLENMLELVMQAELEKKELETIVRRVHATRSLLEEHTIELSKRTIDLVCEFYIPPRRNKRSKL